MHPAPLVLLPLLSACALAGAPALSTTASPVPAPLVLSVDGGFDAAALPVGTTVLRRLPHVGALVVRTDASPAELLSTDGVRGVAPDRELHVTKSSAEKGGGVLAPDALGKKAGKPGAGAGTTVAVVDTGVEDSAVLQRSSGRLVSGVDTSEEAGGVRDGHGHGTFMAGLIAGGATGGQQVGVAPAARVVDVKVASSDGTTSLTKVLGGLDWVVQHRAALDIDVVSLSLAAPRPDATYGRDPLTDAAEAVRAAEVVVVVSAGNEAGALGTPGHDPLLMSVGAADTASANKAATAGFSGSGAVAGMPRPDVVAPGVSLLSVLPEGSVLAQANPGAASGGLFRGSGTSQATAVTAGAVSVFLAEQSAAAPSPDDVRASFATAARDLPGSADGAGLVRWPSKVVRWSAEQAGSGSGDAGSPEPTASSWSASSWSASSWSASSWSASSWSASSWSASSWSASSWSASSWSASSWSWRHS